LNSDDDFNDTDEENDANWNKSRISNFLQSNINNNHLESIDLYVCGVCGADSDDALSISSNASNKVKFMQHIEGPNIGPSSSENWLTNEGEIPSKTDLLHKGHINGGKLVVCMVGLPGRGKTYISRKVARYLRWINYRTRAYSLARYRIDLCGGKQTADFYDNTNEENVTLRLDLMNKAIHDMLLYLNRGGECAILDGTNFTRERRAIIQERVSQEDGYEILWIETISDDEEIIKTYLEQLQDHSPDFLSAEDFNARVEYYRTKYETVEMLEGSFVKIYDAGQRLEIHAAQGFVPTKITSFLMNLHVNERPIYISRHGESMFNIHGLIGGDPDLSPRGKLYAEALREFCFKCEDLPENALSVWSSTMKRARNTAKGITCATYVEWRALREIEVGICDGMTYDQVKEKFPEEYSARERDKLNYRYPRGESYLDIINRLEPVIYEMERQKGPLLIIAHQAGIVKWVDWFVGLIGCLFSKCFGAFTRIFWTFPTKRSLTSASPCTR